MKMSVRGQSKLIRDRSKTVHHLERSVEAGGQL
jgi:hypothetical protein